MALLDDLESLRSEAAAAFAAANNAESLEKARVEYLGTRGKLKGLMGRMGEIPKEQKPVVGKRVNEIGAEIQASFEAAQAKSGQAAGAPLSTYDTLKQERLAKLKRYEDKHGVGSAWGARYPASTSSLALMPLEEIRKKFAALNPQQDTDPLKMTEEVCLAARIMLRRKQSKKLMFLTVQDQGGEIQVALASQLLNDETLALLSDTLDLWDIVGVTGKLAFTQNGEPTVWATSAQILTKCIAPPPDKHHGLHDKELRYRKRYLDLISEAQSRKTFILRAKAVAGMRRFLDDQGFLEMETPVLQTIPGGAAARPFITHLNALGMDMYLRIATEIPLKKLLVGGLERVYELGRIFRNEGLSQKHNPEFTSVEIYQAYADLRDMMALTENMISNLAQKLTGGTTVPFRGKQIKLGAPWPRLDYCELLKKHAGVSYDDIPGLEKKLREIGIDPTGLSHVDKIDGVFGEICEPHLVDACFVMNQPKEMSPLCKALSEDPKDPRCRFADRFEAFASGMEIANAYTELNDAVEQRFRFAFQVLTYLYEDRSTLTSALEETVKRKSQGIKVSDWEIEVLENLSKLANARYLAQIDQLEIIKKSMAAAGQSTKELQSLLDGAATAVGVAKKSGVINSLPSEIKAKIELWPNTDKRKAAIVKAMERLTDPSLLVDEDFLEAMEHGMPPAGGLGIGIDRVVMLLSNSDSIRDVIPFPLMRPEANVEQPKAEGDKQKVDAKK